MTGAGEGFERGGLSGRLDPAARAAALGSLAHEPLDVLVVGGGVVGAGAALDAVSRGLRVGLVERDDWAAGSSSRSSMLVNASWRDLERRDLRAVRVALQERSLLLDWLAPHLVHRVPFLRPLVRGAADRVTVGAQALLYDGLSQLPTLPGSLPPHRHLSRRSVRRIAPALPPDTVTGGVQFWDAQVDDARLTVTLVRTAAAYGAQVAGRVEVVGPLRSGADGTVTGVRAVDRRTGDALEIRARVVVLATGVWTDVTAGAWRDEPVPAPAVSKGVHLMVPRAALRSSTGLLLPTPRAVLRITPWGRHWLVGTVSSPWSGPLESPSATAAEVQGLLDLANRHLLTPLRTADVQGAYAGLRPVRASRPWGRVAVAGPGLVVAQGEHLSTYRVTAARAVDAAAALLGGLVERSVTDRLPLVGADGYAARWNQRHLLARRAGLHVAWVEHLLNRYGSLADEVLSLVRTRPELGRPLPGAEDYLAAEIVYAASHEDATRLGDVLARRTRIAVDTGDRGRTAAAPAAALLAPVLGWSDTETARQVATYAP